MKVTVFLALFVSATPVFAAPDKAAYELQERCGKRAAEVDKANGPSIRQTKDGTTISSYVAHYNARSNRCFALITSSGFVKSNTGNDSFRMESLFDVNSNREHGGYYQRNASSKVMMCRMDDHQCRSKDEWDALVKPYMED